VKSWDGAHPMAFEVACCSGRRLLLCGMLVCSVCDGPAILQTPEPRYEKVPMNVKRISIKPIT
jgi:hypothetical protein